MKQIPWNKLTPEEKIVVKYFLTYKSVGDLIILRDLRMKGIERPTRVLESLIQKGILVKGEGCYSLSKEYR
ncbi:hypothetical protein IPA_05835 [Ignicoccus pacificus DSM 13166]|uniref:Uncharacterized protein n=1 Tax=Ignicoccus pacificus DSM 13166 TaxID=940294 RepID=A0A977PK59_9CREN|nr:hypothetical protein IPA_05835 [Ignicoccus pacificus DSM 13166]